MWDSETGRAEISGRPLRFSSANRIHEELSTRLVSASAAACAKAAAFLWDEVEHLLPCPQVGQRAEFVNGRRESIPVGWTVYVLETNSLRHSCRDRQLLD